MNELERDKLLIGIGNSIFTLKEIFGEEMKIDTNLVMDIISKNLNEIVNYNKKLPDGKYDLNYDKILELLVKAGLDKQFAFEFTYLLRIEYTKSLWMPAVTTAIETVSKAAEIEINEDLQNQIKKILDEFNTIPTIEAVGLKCEPTLRGHPITKVETEFDYTEFLKEIDKMIEEEKIEEALKIIYKNYSKFLPDRKLRSELQKRLLILKELIS